MLIRYCVVGSRSFAQIKDLRGNAKTAAKDLSTNVFSLRRNNKCTSR